MKKIFKNSLVALLLVGLIAGCQVTVDSQETITENTQVITSEDNSSNTKSITSKVALKKTSEASSEIKETQTKETSDKVKETTQESREAQAQVQETTKASEVKVSQANASETEAKQTKVKQTEVKQTTKEVKLKSVEEVAKEVLNGKYGNGEQRKANLEKEGYNYNKVQTAVEKLIPTPTQPRQTQAQQSSTTQQSQTQYNYAPLSLVINGEYFTMNTPYGPGEEPQTPVLQAILDRYNKEWVVENAINYKTHGDGQMPYLSMHNYPWGHYITQVNQILFTDSNGITKTYVKAQTHGPIAFATGADNPERRALLNGEYGDGLVFQTCVDNYYNFVLVRFVLAE